MDEYTRTDAFEKAASLGLVAFIPADDELQIDLDSAADAERFSAVFPILEEHFDLLHYQTTTSQSGEGQHVRIRMPFPLTPLERIAFQAALGSDVKRELLALIALQTGGGVPTVLFETPAVAETLKGWTP